MKIPTGVRRLDDLLGGGLPAGSFTLLAGPPFVGKDVLADSFLLAGMRQGTPGVSVLTDEGAPEHRARLAQREKEYPALERKGLSHVVDCYTKPTGGGDSQVATEYVDGPMNLNALSVAVNAVQARVVGKHPAHRLVLDSLSTLIAYANAQTVFRFLQVLIGRTRRAGATALLMLDDGMHSEADVRALKHLVDGVVELRNEGRKNMVRVEGLGLTEPPGWVEYRFDERAFEVTGSFAAGRIR